MSAIGAEPLVSGPSRRRFRLMRGGGMPYLLVLPTLLALLVVFGYPLYRMVVLSFQNMTARNLYRDETPAWAGLSQYSKILQDSTFWTVVLRTMIFTVGTVAMSLLLGMIFALLLNRVSAWAKIMLTTVLMLVWAMPQIVSIQLFSWLTDPDFSVVNWLLDKLPGVSMSGHDWYLSSTQGLSVASAVVIWGAVPFLAITLHAGMTMVPRELIEAARVDGAGVWRTFIAVTLPILTPLLLIITTLSIIWDV